MKLAILSFMMIALTSASICYAADRALIVGVETYQNPKVPRTLGCAEDGRSTAEFIKAKYGFPDHGIKLLINEQSTAASIEQNFRTWLIAGVRGVCDGYVVQGAMRDSRNLVLVNGFTEVTKLAVMSGVVVISATSNGQAAYPVRGNWQYRGALPYLFVESQRTNAPTIQDLQATITSRILQLQRTGKLDCNQQPVFNVISTVPLNGKPLFASWMEPQMSMTGRARF